MKLKGKVIFIISYENWGKMQMSKHHYAIELGKAGNKVYFINHPDKRKELKRGEVIVKATEAENVLEVKHRLFHPYFFKSRYKKLYNVLTSFHIKKIIDKIGVRPHVVWSFDTSNALPLEFFPGSNLKILMPVDGPFWHEDERMSSKSADVIVSVTDRILEPFRQINVPKLKVNHGVSDVFLKNGINYKKNNPIQVGYSGSLIRNDLDTKVFLQLIKGHPNVVFNFWGEDDYRKSNIHLPQDVKLESRDFLQLLKTLPNVRMHGPVNSQTLAEGLGKMDILLICYAIKNDQNHHKVLEYLGTGNVIVSNFMSSYVDHPDLIEMAANPDNNDDLPSLFTNVLNNLEHYNSHTLRERRIGFAKEYSYRKNVERIEEFINKALTETGNSIS